MEQWTIFIYVSSPLQSFKNLNKNIDEPEFLGGRFEWRHKSCNDIAPNIYNARISNSKISYRPFSSLIGCTSHPCK